MSEDQGTRDRALMDAAMDSALDALVIVDARGEIVAANPAAAVIFREPVERMVGSNLQEFSGRSDTEDAVSWTALMNAGRARSFGPLRRRDGTVATLSYQSRVEPRSGRVVIWLRESADATPAGPLGAETALRAVLSSAPVVLFATDEKGTFTVSAGRGLQEVGLKPGEVVGQSAWDLFGSVQFRAPDGTTTLGREVLTLVLAGKPFVGWSHLGASDFDNWINPILGPDGSVKGIIGVATLSTERRRLEAQLQISDRLASVGAMAAGVAHELNNPLAYVLANLRFVQGQLGPGELLQPADLDEVLRALDDTLVGAEKMRVIVGDLKSLSRVNDEERTAVSLTAVLDSAQGIASHELRHRATVVRTLEPDLPAVRANAARLGQVFLNLIVNAAHAIAEHAPRRGELRIEGRRLPGGRVEVAFRDNGSGISPENLNRIFDPFFTTKPVGTGTGLGLPISLRIVEELGGHIAVESTPGVGSTFRVQLPASDTAPSVPAAQSERARSRPRARVLIIDDEPRFADSLARALDEESVVALSRVDALAQLERDPRFDLVVCDVMMPDVKGPVLVDEIAARWPELAGALVLMTGGAYSADAIEGLAASRFPKIEKPFDVERLRRFIDARTLA
jgi:signal transduction histidine kinase/CheY-like chemotaxis protein